MAKKIGKKTTLKGKVGKGRVKKIKPGYASLMRRALAAERDAKASWKALSNERELLQTTQVIVSRANGELETLRPQLEDARTALNQAGSDIRNIRSQLEASSGKNRDLSAVLLEVRKQLASKQDTLDTLHRDLSAAERQKACYANIGDVLATLYLATSGKSEMEAVANFQKLAREMGCRPAEVWGDLWREAVMDTFDAAIREVHRRIFETPVSGGASSSDESDAESRAMEEMLRDLFGVASHFSGRPFSR